MLHSMSRLKVSEYGTLKLGSKWKQSWPSEIDIRIYDSDRIGGDLKD